ncbi:potassium channel family protein [Clostridium tetanomorphum]|uniref:Potassium channel family protein n=2 Tax=Clostridium tetanomorphum TaxID=1553 RepID=A0A923J2J8_CLOTT|nr:potassium channel family protein [Clostridium tetanomorphum]
MYNLKNNKKYFILYEITIAILALISLLILIISIMVPKEVEVLNLINNIILFIFATDYLVRLILSKDKKAFFRRNLIDLIAIIPFDPIFQVVKLTRLLRFVKIIRVLAIYSKFRKSIDNFIKTNSFNYVLWITLSILILGALGIHLCENMTLGNSLWWSFVTITTVGYGDISPKTPFGRLIAVFLMLTGIGFLSMLTGTIATFFINKGKNKNCDYRCETIKMIQNKLDNFDSLTKSDIDDICKVLNALKNS